MAANESIDPTKNIGDDATATFESDPKFTEPTPGSEGSSDNVEEQKALSIRDSDDLEDSEEEEDDDVDEDEEFDDEDEEDEEDLDDDADEDDEEYQDDEDEEDDAEEVAASAPLLADGLLGYEDEAEDVEKGRSESDGNAQRLRTESKLKNDFGNLRGTDEEDDDAGDVAPGVSEDEITEDDLDTDRIAALTAVASQVLAARDAVRMQR